MSVGKHIHHQRISRRSRTAWFSIITAGMAPLLLIDCAVKVSDLSSSHKPTQGKGILLGNILRLGNADDAWVYVERKDQQGGFRLEALGLFKKATPTGSAVQFDCRHSLRIMQLPLTVVLARSHL